MQEPCFDECPAFSQSIGISSGVGKDVFAISLLLLVLSIGTKESFSAQSTTKAQARCGSVCKFTMVASTVLQ